MSKLDELDIRYERFSKKFTKIWSKEGIGSYQYEAVGKMKSDLLTFIKNLN